MRYQDFRVAARVIARHPIPTALSVISIALGIGLTTAVFSVGDALVLRPLSIERPAEVFTVTSRGDDGAVFMYGWPDYQDMRKSGAGIVEIAAYQRRGAMLAGEQGSEMVLISPVTPNYFALLGVRAALGRASVEPRDGRPAVVLGYRLWQRRFGGDPEIAGKSLVLGDKALAVTGVLPADFGGLERGVANDLWVSTDAWFDVLARGDRNDRADQFELIARLKPGATTVSAAAQLDAGIRGPGRRKPAPRGTSGTLLEATFAPGWKQQLLAGGGLIAILALVLFVACANVAQLRLAQAEARKRELAVRMALGAGSRRILGQLLLETGLVAIPGAVFGLWLAGMLLGKAIEFLTIGRAFVDPGIRLDSRVLAFTIAATLFSVLIAGLAPARIAVRLSISEAIKTEQGATGARTGWRQKLLIGGQTAVSVALFGAALMFVQSFWSATAIRPGFEPTKKLLVVNAVPALKIPSTAWSEQICDRLAALPGARAATFARRLPLSDSGGGANSRVEISGRAPVAVHHNNVAGNYFSVMGTRVVTGRGIDSNDRENTQPVIVISQSFAQQFFAGGNPVGQWVRVRNKLRLVVGIAEDGPSNHLHEAAEPYVYFPCAQVPADDITIMLETVNDPAKLSRSMTRTIKQFDPGALVYGMETLQQRMDYALSTDRLMAATASTLGLLSVVLMAAGLFGALQYAVSQRSRELGLRVALGATPQRIERMMLSEALGVAVWAIPIGLALLVALASFARSQVLGLHPLHPAVYFASAIAVLAIVACSAWLPARRATHVDPMDVLRSD